MNDALLSDGVLLRLTWQSTAWLLAGLAASFVFHRHPARAHAALGVALAGLFVTPFADLAVSRFGCGLLQPPSVRSSVSPSPVYASADLPQGEFELGSLVADEQPLKLPVPKKIEEASAPVAQVRSLELTFRPTFPGVLSAVWMLMSAALAARMALAAWRARRLVAGKGPVAAGHLSRCLAEAAARIELGVTPVLGTADVRSPIVWCWGRCPTVLVPLEAEADGAGIDWVGVFRHELAHWKRKDHVTGILAQAAIVLLPWNPFTWWAARRLHELSEQACDQWAVADGRSPLDFAESLLGLHPENRHRAALAAVSGRSLLAVRVRRLLQFEPADPRPGRTWTAVVLGMSLLTAAALALAQSAPVLSAKSTVAEAAADADADAELHVIGIYEPKDGPRREAGRVNVTVRPTSRPVVLVLSSYFSVNWHITLADGAQIKEVLLTGYNAQEITGLPADVPLVNQSYYPVDGSRRKNGWFYAYQWDTVEYRRAVETLNDRTGLLVSTAQLEYTGASFVVDGTRGRNYAQKERKPRRTLPAEPTREELLAASADAGLHVVGAYQAALGNGAPVGVEVRPTGKPIVLVLTSYSSILWRVKVAQGAQLKAVIIGGYDEQEFEGIPEGVPIVSRTFFPARQPDYFYAYSWNTTEYRRMVEKLNEMTGLTVSTFQSENKGTAFVVDGARGHELAQKEETVEAAKAGGAGDQPKKVVEDPLADVADIPSQELKAGGDADKRYLLIGPREDARPPAEGYGLVVIMPGGDGSADFHPFVKRIYKNALSERYLAVQPVAIRWTPDQEIVWPTKKNPVARMKFGTEEFVEAVIEDAAKKHKLDRSKVFSLSWSSSGPAAYAISLQDKSAITGSYVAMSVFHPGFLPPLGKASGHPYYLYHSRDDRVCPFRMAEQAEKDLTTNGAKVRLETYEGGHGWRGNVYEDIRQGIEWLEKNHAPVEVP